MKIEVHERLAGTTIMPTWVNSGQSPSSIISILRDASDAVVNTATPVSSGNGFYFSVHALPSSPNVWYVQEWLAIISANTYRDRQYINALGLEVG